MVECLVWDQDAAGSSPVTSTKIKAVDSLESTAFSFASTHFSTHLPIFFVSRAPNPCTYPDLLPLVHPSFQHPDDI